MAEEDDQIGVTIGTPMQSKKSMISGFWHEIRKAPGFASRNLPARLMAIEEVDSYLDEIGISTKTVDELSGLLRDDPDAVGVPIEH